MNSEEDIPSRKDIRKFFMFISGFILLGILYNLLPTTLPFKELIFPCFIFLWILRISFGILHRQIRLYLILIGTFTLFYLLLRIIKFNAFSDHEGNIIRFLWYLYYIPMMAIPLLSFFAASLLGTAHNAKLKKSIMLLCLPLSVLIIAVLTNDYHQTVFKFLPELENWNTNYTYGFTYVIIWLWNAVLFILTVATAYKKSSFSSERKYLVLPLFAPSLCIVYLSLYQYMRNFPLKLPEVYCFMAIGFWEGLIRIGFVQSNMNYRNYFKLSHISAQIVNFDGIPVYSSNNTAKTAELIRQKGVIDENTALHSKKISAGAIFWLENTSELNRLNRALSESAARLSEETDLLAAENRVREETESLKEQNKIYDRISACTAEQLRLVSELVSEAEKNPALFEKNMALACFFTVYIKRKSNMLLRKNRTENLSAGDLLLAISESAEYLTRCNIPCLCECEENLPLTSDEVFTIFDMFEGFIEKNYKELVGFMMNIKRINDKIIIKITAEGKLSYTSLCLNGFKVFCDSEPNALYFTLEKNIGGEVL